MSVKTLRKAELEHMVGQQCITIVELRQRAEAAERECEWLRVVARAARVVRTDRKLGCGRSPQVKYQAGDGLCDNCKVTGLCIALAALSEEAAR